ncbi:hypothetical protein TELCIR_24855 [Teladorsagia circumcincta]|uniref:Uncharacterized protein n=1 Tax=Teladorsagia circumcincta TaxID=45464 RepID=A0A2G9T731_TELCI|nr:hypothetical protein TELCIR_24855 [Teladorsagia circumcincta]
MRSHPPNHLIRPATCCKLQHRKRMMRLKVRQRPSLRVRFLLSNF